MKKTLTLLAIIFMPWTINAREMSVEEAMETMRTSVTSFLKGEYSKVDATGIDQYVDADISKVYKFSDYSFGALLKDFEPYLAIDQNQSNKRLTRKKMKILEYAKNHQTEVAAYAANVEYFGITKFHEKLSSSLVAFFDWKGEVIAVRPSDYDRDQYKSKLCKTMEKHIVQDLTEQYAPMFLPEDYWVSNVASVSQGKYSFLMQWCYVLSREKPTGDGITRGSFVAYYYQRQEGGFNSNKSIMAAYGEYVWDNDGIEFSYHNCDADAYVVMPDFAKKFEPEDFKDLDKSQMTWAMSSSIKFKKLVSSSPDIPKVFRVNGPNSFTMSVPMDNKEYTFTKVED